MSEISCSFVSLSIETIFIIDTMKRIFSLLCLLLLLIVVQAQQKISLPANMPQDYPRVLTTPAGRAETKALIDKEPWAKEVFTKLKQRTDVYTAHTEAAPDWLFSRLAMYWNSHATDVYIKGETFDRAGGAKAPAPTVRYTGTRGTANTHSRPKLENILPYDDADGDVTFCNNALPGHPMERVHPSKTGRNIESINREIMGIARDAAFLYWMTGEKKYATLAAGVFDTYMTGIYYRNIPIDLNHGHQQTLVGMSSFEVIHEDVLDEIVPLYDFLHDYLKANYAGKMAIYAGAFKKWADNIIENGVPHNNWNLMQARYIMNIGLVLEDNANYSDGKGREYYIDYVLNRSSIRQWSLSKLAAYGFDAQTGIWAECPGYSCGVVGDYANFANLFDRNLSFDLVRAMPVVATAVAATPQYLFPNGMICGFGDTHPGTLRTDIFGRMIQNAQLYGKKEQERRFTAMLKCFRPDAAQTADAKKKDVRVSVNSFFDDKPLTLDAKIPAGQMSDYVSPLFYAPNVSWLVQRNGMNARHSLMISQNASEGNHMHANGISMELYGKGFVLGPDAGIGTSGYSGLDYSEYYGQFPSHNTVCVDGISSYPIMKSNHAFDVRACFPEANSAYGTFPAVTFSDVSFREPESRADQTRTMSIVTTGATTGYYVDIFRSRKERGGDKMHDYFYHNLGQTLTLTTADGTSLGLQPSEELAFAGAHLYAYSYLFDKKMAVTDQHVKATFTVTMPQGDDISMNLWMKGEKDRQLFTALAPMTEGLSRTPGMPYSIKDQPTLTFVARQSGEAWTRPFVSIFEPSSKNEPSAIASVSYFNAEGAGDDFAGICVESKNGRQDYIFSLADATRTATYQRMEVKGSYALIGHSANGECTILLGHGTSLIAPGVEITAPVPVSVLLEKKAGHWSMVSATGDCTVKAEGKRLK